MLPNEVRNKLYKELELQLDNKQFFNATDYYKSNSNSSAKNIEKIFSAGNITYAKPSPIEKSYDYANTVKGLSFSNKVDSKKKSLSVEDLSFEERKIYKIADLLEANLEETIVIPYNVMSTSLALVKRFDWKDVLFSDVSTAWGILKNKLNIK